MRMQLRRLIKQFLHTKQFFGAGGLEMTDEIRVTIAAEACMLLLNRPAG
ncbi:MAG: zinc-dependent peptidase, partial [Desulfuromonadales bacterium]|nr:zinc-dependent peptidase [Desulfuromonadales bacterium]NIS39824.1 zinc-dependent peptidase [Desulfuromonadales bacterium]